MKITFTLLLAMIALNIFSQRGKDGAVTINAANTIVNAYTSLTADANSGTSIINVANSAGFNVGDLVLIVQMQGSKVNAYWEDGVFNDPNNSTANPSPSNINYGAILDYYNSGNNEFAEITSVPNSTSLILDCSLTNNYTYSLNINVPGSWGNHTAYGNVQIIKVPRYNSLTVNAGGSITCPQWNGQTGGVVAIEVQNNVILSNSPSIDVNGKGFRGGIKDNATSVFGGNKWGAVNPNQGGYKGESIAGDTTICKNYAALIGRGAIANGGGGGDAHNAGGGGGANAGAVAGYNGYGNPVSGYTTIWNLEAAGFASNTSSGGGRGGYTFSNQNRNVTTTAPGLISTTTNTWGGDYRRNAGGLGGRPLDYSTGKIFLGGGGGAGDGNENQAGAGGNGGGLVFLVCYGNLSGAGTISADGNNGSHSTPGCASNDGGGGGGGGGTVILKVNGTNSLTAPVSLSAKGGDGGNVRFNCVINNYDGYGPGGGGGGGYIASSGTLPSNSVIGGSNGIQLGNGASNANSISSAFPPNGATKGGSGSTATVNAYTLTTSANQTLCANQAFTVTASSNEPGTSINWFNNNTGGTAIATGTAYVSTGYTTAGTYTIFAGSCPGTYRQPIIITVNSGLTISVNSPTICPNQTVTLTASGATTYTWNPGGLTGNTISVSPSSTTIYTINGANSLCSGTQTTNVTVSSAPTVSVPNATICAGTSTVLTASGTATSFTWMPGNITTSTISANSNATYTITGSNGTCTNSTVATVTVVALPTVSVPNATICAGTSTVLTASGTATSFTWMPGNITTSTISANSNATYTVTGSNGTCTNSTTATVTVNTLPTVSVPNATICAGSSTVLTASGTATSFTWMPGSVTTSTISANSNTTYTITGSNGTCTNSTTATVTVVTLPTVSVPNATICSGTSTVLAASGTATSFTWMPGSVTTSTISANAAANYTITGSNGTCTNSTTASVSVIPTPTLSANSATICAGQVATFTVSGATSYTWNPGGITGTTFTLNPASSGTVSVIGANGNCSSQITRSVTVTPNPTIAVSNQTICPTQSVILTASGATTYSWNTGPTTNTISVSPSSTTIYTVTGTSSLCSNTQTVSVTVASQPTVAVANASICSGNATTLTASGATNYTWMPGGQLTSTVSVNPGSTTIYTITGSNGTCSATTAATLNVTSTPTLVANSTTICPSQTATLTVSGATTYTWNPGNITGNTYTISPASNTTVSVVGANGSCTASAIASITIGSGISISVNNPTICAGQTASLTASGATSYTWDTGANTNTLNVSPASTQTYTISGTSGACSGSNTAVVTVVSVPSLTVADAAICSGNTATLSASGANSYTWMPGGQTTSVITDNPSTTTVYTITGSNGACSNTTTATVSVTATPTLVANSATICPSQTATLTVSGATTYTWNPGTVSGNTYTISPSSNTVVTIDGANGTCTAQTTASVTIGTGISITVNSPTICAGETASLTASGATSYTWDTGANTNTLNVSPASTQVYTVSGMNGTCSGSNTAVVTVNSIPSVSVTSASVCTGSSGTLTASGATNYTWMPGGQLTASITDNPSSTTIYTVTGANGTCTNTTTGTISVTPTPTLTVNSATICAGQTATLTASGATTYTWNPGNLTGTPVTVTPTVNTTYTITGANGACTGSVTSNVTVTNCNNICSFNLGNDTAFCSPMNYIINGPSGFTSYSWAPGGATTQNINATNTDTYICTATILSNDLVANGDFSLGNTMFASNYVVPTVPGPFGLLSNPGTYIITTNPNSGHINFMNFGDHTTGSGNMMVCNGSAMPNDIVWTETITVSPNTNYNFSAWVASVYNTTPGNEAQLQFSINSGLLGSVYSAPLIGGVWGNFSVNWNSGANTSAVITIVDQNFTAPGANDFALDDIFYQQVCSYSDTIIVTENQTPTVTASATSSAICLGNSTSLTANGASTYTWTGGILNSASFSPTVTTTYTVVGASVAGCTNTAVQTITVNSIPTISVTSSNICSGQNATLTASGANTYTWSNSVTGSSQTVNPSTTTIYTVSGTDVNGCMSSTAASSTVNVSATPTISVNSPTICGGQTATLTATGALSFTWSTTETSATIVTTPALTNTYSVVGDNGGGCASVFTTTVSVTPSPTITSSSASLGGCAPFCTNFTDVVSASATGIVYNFGDGNTANTNNPNHCYANGGNYTVTATATNSVLGCSSIFTLPVITVNPKVVADFNIAEGNVVAVGSNVNFINTSSNATMYVWDVLCTGQTSTATNFMTALADTGTCCISLIADNISGCPDTVVKCINIVKEAVVIVPNVFTPNGDGSNEFFKISSSGLKSLNCIIYDRWGLKMHEWDGLNGYWDGNAKNGEAPSGTYFYIINYTDQLDNSTTEKGFLNLFRD